MLDDPKFIAHYDPGDALGVIAGQPLQLDQAYEVTQLHQHKLKRPSSIVVAGMGGSALAAEFVKSWLGDRLPVPLIVVRDYSLPAFVGPDTLVVASSYSGNTEETLSALVDAQVRGAQIVISASGGKLLEHAEDKAYPHFILPSGFQPRLAVLYGVKALALLLENADLELTGLADDLHKGAAWMMHHQQQWQAEAPIATNQAKQIARSLYGNPVVIYGGSTLMLPAMKWKIDFNENSKNLAFYNYLPEFNHNEFLGWGHPIDKHIKVVELLSNLDHPHVQKRFKVTNKLLADMMPVPIEVNAVGDNKLEQMLWTLLLGDYVSAYLAFLNGIDPTPVALIEKFKHELE